MPSEADIDALIASTPAARKPSESEVDAMIAKAHEPETSGLESFARGAAQGASLGFADELTGGAEALADKLQGRAGDFSDNYAKHRDESRTNFDKAAKDHPWLYGGGGLAGGLATGLATGGLGLGVEAAEGAGLAARLGAGALNGMGQGAIMGLGTSSAHDIDGALRDTATGAALGGVVGAGAEGIGAGLGRLNKYAGGKVEEGLDAAKQIAIKNQDKLQATAGRSLGGETQKGNRLVENLQRLLGDPDVEMTPERQAALENWLNSPANKGLKEKLFDSTLGQLPSQHADIEAKAAQLAELSANRQQMIAEDAARIAGPEEAMRQIGERAKRYGPVWAGGIAGKVLGTAETPGLLAGAGIRPGLKAVGRMLDHPSVKVPTFKALQALTSANPAALSQAIGAPRTAVLQKALAEGPDQFNIAHYVMQLSQPDYQNALTKLEDDKNGNP